MNVCANHATGRSDVDCKNCESKKSRGFFFPKETRISWKKWSEGFERENEIRGRGGKQEAGSVSTFDISRSFDIFYGQERRKREGERAAMPFNYTTFRLLRETFDSWRQRT